MSPTLLLYDHANSNWLDFTHPVRILEAYTLADVLPALAEIDRAVQQGLWAAGFIAYEAAPAFDPAMITHPPMDGLPLLWFGIFKKPNDQWSMINDQFSTGNSPLIIDHSQLTIDHSSSAYNAALAHIKDHIAAGNTYQVNYTMRLHAHLQTDPLPSSPHPLFSSSPVPPYAATLHTGRHAICSASPELFFELNNGILRSKPMKGTAPRGRTLAEDHANADWLHHSEKNRAENVMIVDMVRNDMGRIAEVGSVRVPHLFDIERYPTVLQMTSTVECETQASLPEIFTALFPCASITGAPKIRTMQIIRDLEPEPRGVYTGTIGFIVPGNAISPGNSTHPRRAQFNVAIRTLVVDTHTRQATYGIGSGIVWDSDPAEEYEECLLKARVLTVRRPEFEILESMLWTPDEGYFLLERHLERMRDSAEYFDFPFVEEKILAILNENTPVQPTSHKTRLLLNRTGDVTIEQHPLPASFAFGYETRTLSTVRLANDAQDAFLKVTLAPSPVSSIDTFLFHKTTHRAVYDQARAACPGFDEVLLWNERGEITEFLTCNVVVQMYGEMFTPPVECGLLGGTFRRALLEQGTVTERVIPREQLAGAEAVWAVNSVRGWRKVIGNWVIG